MSEFALTYKRFLRDVLKFYRVFERQQVARQINSSDYHDWEGFDTTPTLPTRQSDAAENGMFIKFNDGDLKDVPGNGDVEVYLLTAVWWNCLPVVKDVNEADATATATPANTITSEAITTPGWLMLKSNKK